MKTSAYSFFLAGLLAFMGHGQLFAEPLSSTQYYRILCVDGPESLCVTAMPEDGRIVISLAKIKDDKPSQRWQAIAVKPGQYRFINQKYGNDMFLSLGKSKKRMAKMQKQGQGVDTFSVLSESKGMVIVAADGDVLTRAPEQPRRLRGMARNKAAGRGKHLFRFQPIGQAPGVASQKSSLKDASPAQPEAQSYPVGIPSGQQNYVVSPYVKKDGLVDVTGFSSGEQARCPYTGKIFLVP